MDADLRGAILRGANLKRTNLKGANLTGTAYLLVEQLCEAATLYQDKLDPDLQHKASYECPSLFEKPKEKVNR